MGTPPAATAPTPANPLKRHFIIEIWDENREAFKAILADTFLGLTAFAGLFAIFFVLHRMEQAGYGHDRIETFETIHFWGYLIVLGLFLADLIMKLFTFFFLKRKP